MDYLTVYKSIIRFRKKNIPNGYSEIHHIVPSSLGGSNKSYNKVKLTSREHFICHLLLTKIFKEHTIEWCKMMKAFLCMKRESLNQYRYFNSRFYDYLRKGISISNSINQSGSGNSQYGKIWIYNDSERKNKKILKSDTIPDNWYIGRKIKWDIKDIQKEKEDLREKNKKIKIDFYSNLYIIYNKYGWNKLLELTNYNKTKQNLVQMFIEYVPEFKPQNGKTRGKINSI